MIVVLPAPVWPTMASVCPGCDAEGNIAQHPIFFLRIGAAAIGKPDIAEFDFAAHVRQGLRLGRRNDRDRLIEQLEDALGSRHRGLQNVEFFAQILNRAEEALRVHHERDEHADFESAGDRAHAAHPVQQRNAAHAEEFNSRKEVGECVDRVFVRFHVDAVQVRRTARATSRSRLKSCTTDMPLMCSCRKPLIRAMAVRMRRLASRTWLRKK